MLVDAGHRAWLLEANAAPDVHMRCARRAAAKRVAVRGALALAVGGAGGEAGLGEEEEDVEDVAALRRWIQVL